jgi:hypothetical protein
MPPDESRIFACLRWIHELPARPRLLRLVLVVPTIYFFLLRDLRAALRLPFFAFAAFLSPV